MNKTAITGYRRGVQAMPGVGDRVVIYDVIEVGFTGTKTWHEFGSGESNGSGYSALPNPPEYRERGHGRVVAVSESGKLTVEPE